MVSVTDRQQLDAAVHRIDAELKRLTEPGVQLTGPRLLERTRDYAERHRRTEPERLAARQEADSLIPALLDLYTRGDDSDREWVRGLLRACPAFRWAAGWPLSSPKPLATCEQMLTALALLSMKDGETDSRDQWVWLQGLCAHAQKSGLDLPVLLRRAAGWSSDAARFPPAPSTRALLLQFADRFAS